MRGRIMLASTGTFRPADSSRTECGLTNETEARKVGYARAMLPCIRLWTGDDSQSHFEQGHIALEPGPHGDLASGQLAVTTVSFEETARGGAFDWHTAPVRQLVITLSGTLDFQTRAGRHF